MTPSRQQDLLRYGLGLCATLIGAWLTDVSGSMLPLALGASASLLCTLPLVKAIWTARRRPR